MDEEGARFDDDALLIAYCDGALEELSRLALEKRIAIEPALRGRLAALRAGDRDFGPAFDALLAVAPADRLRARLDSLIARNESDARSRRRGPSWMAMVAVAVVILAVGGGGGFFVTRLLPQAQPGWRQVVAEYQTLTTARTLAALDPSPDLIADELRSVGAALSLPLAAPTLALPDVVLKRANLLEFAGKPLAELAYLSASGPITFCIINNGRPDAAAAFEQREGYNIVFWTSGGRGYMVIGKAERDVLETLASDLAARFS